jgi:hypothetical protein
LRPIGAARNFIGNLPGRGLEDLPDRRRVQPLFCRSQDRHWLTGFFTASYTLTAKPVLAINNGGK